MSPSQLFLVGGEEEEEDEEGLYCGWVGVINTSVVGLINKAFIMIRF